MSINLAQVVEMLLDLLLLLKEFHLGGVWVTWLAVRRLSLVLDNVDELLVGCVCRHISLFVLARQLELLFAR